MAENNVEAVAIYMDLILGSELDAQAKQELLAAKNREQFSALSIAFDEHADQAIETYTEAILTSQLPNESKRELLLARVQDGLSKYEILNTKL